MRPEKNVHATALALLRNTPRTTRDEGSSTVISFVLTQKQQSSAKKVYPPILEARSLEGLRPNNEHAILQPTQHKFPPQNNWINLFVSVCN